ncbi:hypothetical protein [Pendulispora albinea]|uniref:Uncharacterized protein n=1 Tax=Pendulispora albinea TaxID=2741071 RepID=A0ABZ2MBI6_9BACT
MMAPRGKQYEGELLRPRTLEFTEGLHFDRSHSTLMSPEDGLSGQLCFDDM